MTDDKKTLVLIGGGHGHLYLLKHFIANKIPGYQVLLISEGQRQYYSGMASGYMEDIYKEEDFSVDLAHICKQGGISFVQDLVEVVDPINKFVVTKAGEKYAFDVASFDTGSMTLTDHIKGAKKYAKQVKPLNELTTVKDFIKEAKTKKAGISIVGGGASSVELALAMIKYGAKQGKELDVTIIAGKHGILNNYNAGLKKHASRVLKREGIRVLEGNYVTSIDEKTLSLASGKTMKYDIVLLATGSVAHPVYKNSGLKTDGKGYMLSNTYLQNIDYPYIFGIGDCIAFQEYDYVTKVGVYAVREGAYLLENIKRHINNKPLKAYIPQKKYLSILSTGNRTGVLEFHRLVASGTWVWKLKNKIDVSFIQQFQ